MPYPETPPPPGIRLIMKSPEQENPAIARVAEYSDWLRLRMHRKSEANELIFQYDKEPIDAELLAQAPLFNFGEGFESESGSTLKQETETAVAPMSQEEMRILLVRSLPATLIPFALNYFVLNFAPMPATEEDESPPGPIIKLQEGKINITFFRNNFFTEGAPEFLKTSPSPTDKERAKHVAAFLDPSKINLFFGKIFAKMMKRPDDWNEIIDPSFTVTNENLSRNEKREQNQLPQPVQNELRLQKQWEDFVALAIANPEIAKSQNIEAFKEFDRQVEKFADVTYDKAAIASLAQQSYNGVIELNDLQTVIDLRTEEEIQQSAGLSPQLAFYEEFIKGINKFTSKFGYILSYKKPPDPWRAILQAEDDKEIKRMIESSSVEERDVEFGEILANTGNEKNQKAKNEARRILLSYSQEGEFNEWRIWAWLYKFSDTFRKTNGRHISEDDYEDLQLIYNQSEKIGNRLGTSVVPYEAILLDSKTHPDAHLYGRKVRVIVRRDQKKHFEKVLDKVLSKQPRAILDANDDAFDMFQTPDGQWIPLTAKYNASPEGMMSANGNLEDILGPKFGQEVSEQMARMGIGKIPADAIALAKGHEMVSKRQKQMTDRYMKPAAVKVLQHYAGEFNEPPEKELANLKALSAKEIARSGDVEHIVKQWQEAGNVQVSIKTTLGTEAARSPLLDMTKDHFLSIITKHPNASNHDLFYEMTRFIYTKLGDNTLGARQEYTNFVSLLFRPKTQQALKMLLEASEYRQELEPRYALKIEGAVVDIRSNPDLLLGDKEVYRNPTENDRLKLLAKYKIIDLRELERQGSLPHADTAPDAAATPAEEPAVPTISEDQTLGARQSYVKEKISQSDPTLLRSAVLDYLEEALKKLDGSLSQEGLGDTYTKRYEDWQKAAGRIIKAPSLQSSLGRDLSVAVAAADHPGRNPDELLVQRAGLNQISGAIKEAEKSILFERLSQTAQKETKKPAFLASGENNEEDMESRAKE